MAYEIYVVLTILAETLGSQFVFDFKSDFSSLKYMSPDVQISLWHSLLDFSYKQKDYLFIYSFIHFVVSGKAQSVPLLNFKYHHKLFAHNTAWIASVVSETCRCKGLSLFMNLVQNEVYCDILELKESLTVAATKSS